MLSEQQIQAYREMSQAERWRLVEALMTFAWQSLRQLPHDETERRLAYDAERHDRSDAIILAHLRRLQ